MKLKTIIQHIEEFAPLSLQESYDNSGLIVGNRDSEVSGVLLSIDINEDVLEEAIQKKCNLIIAHHPILFSGIKRITGKTYVERCILKAIKNDIALYACHTSIDMVSGGVSFKMAEKLNLKNIEILSPSPGTLKKLVVYIPVNHFEEVSAAIFASGAGKSRNYDFSSFRIKGTSSFRPLEGSTPYKGEIMELYKDEEIRFETIVSSQNLNKAIQAIYKTHPYEEPAFDIMPLEQTSRDTGLGAYGDLEEPIPEKKFIQMLKEQFNVPVVRCSPLLNKEIKKVAMCGGSGSTLLSIAISKKADTFITGDFKYHQFFDADNKILIADIGHFESEQFTTEIFYDILTKKISNFVPCYSEVKTNQINYF